VETETHLEKLMRENQGLEDVIKTNMMHISQLMMNQERIKQDHELVVKELNCQNECLTKENYKLYKMVHLMKRELDTARN
jgi:methyl coenzyme M reductase subunit C-like uncharacterized protein (methanogenesis marker protein 7)